MSIQEIVREYHPRFIARYGDKLTRDQWSALNAMLGCRTEQYGQIAFQCQRCDWQTRVFQSCGHRACSGCQHNVASQWLERQQEKLLPIQYFMVTFTLPRQLRGLFKAFDATCYPLLFHSAVQTLKQFAVNDKKLQGEIGLTGVLHTHSRRLDYHPHIHFIVPAGSFHQRTNLWAVKPGDYLFNEKNLAKVFRAILLQSLRHHFPSLPGNIPKEWIVDCQKVGKGLPALQYLSRYLYRGVISDKHIVKNDGTQVTFSYKDSNTGNTRYRTLTGEAFIFLLLQHTLPKGFRRVRDYGFLHGNSSKTLKRIQLALRVRLPKPQPRVKAFFQCAKCQCAATISHFISAVEYRRLHPT